MSEQTGIAWTHHTFNPWWGCTKVSAACDFCYAERDAKRYGFDIWGSRSERRFFGNAHWNGPLKWAAKAKAAGERRRVFCASMADVFEDRRDLADSRQRLWGLIEITPELDWLLLTKRPENAIRLTPVAWSDLGWPVNAWFGFTAEDQESFDRRLPHVLPIPARIKFCSYEPALGPIAFRRLGRDGISWAIVGGESGPKARPFDVEWARDTIHQCREAGAAVFVKQLGRSWYEDLPSGQRQRVFPEKDSKGGDPSEWREDLRVREFPA